MHFGATLRLLRLDAGVTLRHLAERVGVSSAYLSRVENGHDPVPTPDRLASIAAVLDIPVELLFELSHQVSPFVGRYLDQQPNANVLFLEIARRRLSAAQLAMVRAYVERTFPSAHAADSAPSITSLLGPARIVTDLVCEDLEDALEIAAARLTRRDQGRPARELARRLIARERAGATAIGGGIAIPHASGFAGPTRAALVALARPVDAPSPDGRPIDLMLVLAMHGERTQPLLSTAVRLLDACADHVRAELPSPQRVLARLREAERIYVGSTT